ncbi:hypothetical protein E2C01_082935 [Portunus trituberculatus]|uniref:Uncharacterized protein n=1 Tax=Portunus trituberculatus TaxID=210409 RepID=A0A5B7IZT1_PORTR|nr:hypothetical protein [Portunus trituberculatus]
MDIQKAEGQSHQVNKLPSTLDRPVPPVEESTWHANLGISYCRRHGAARCWQSFGKARHTLCLMEIRTVTLQR